MHLLKPLNEYDGPCLQGVPKRIKNTKLLNMYTQSSKLWKSDTALRH